MKKLNLTIFLLLSYTFFLNSDTNAMEIKNSLDYSLDLYLENNGNRSTIGSVPAGGIIQENPLNLPVGGKIIAATNCRQVGVYNLPMNFYNNSGNTANNVTRLNLTLSSRRANHINFHKVNDFS